MRWVSTWMDAWTQNFDSVTIRERAYVRII